MEDCNMQKYIYLTKEELEEMEIRLANDLIAEIKKAIWVEWFDAFKVTIEFDSEEEMNQFCDIYGFEINTINSDFLSEKQKRL